MYPQPGSYMSPYDAQAQQPWWAQYAPPWVGQMQQMPPPWMNPYMQQPPPWAMQQWQGQQQPQGQDMNSQLISLFLSLPAVKAGTVVAQTLQTQLTALAAPPALVNPPTANDYNALLSYSTSVKNAVTQAVGNDATVFQAIKQQITFSALLGMSSGGSNSSLPLILLLGFGGL